MRTKFPSFRRFDFRRAFLSLFTAVFIVSGFLSGPKSVQAAACATGNDVTIAVSCDWAAGTHVYTGTLTINAGVTVTALGNTTTGTGVTVIADNYVINGTIEADSNGYAGGTSVSDDGDGPGGGDSQTGFAFGASHGGRGSENNARGEYGSAYAPILLGSGGGDDGEVSTPGTGGGAFKLFLNGSGTMTFGNGAVLTADGGNASAADSGGGAGGSIWIDAPNGTVTIAATHTASVGAIGGRTGASNGGGAGGGGRIAMYAGTCTNCGNIAFDARGGAQGEQSGAWPEGGAGSIFLKLNGATNGDLIYDNNDFAGAEETTLVASSTNIVDNLIVRDGTDLIIPAGFSLSAAASFTGGGVDRPSITISDGASFDLPDASNTIDDTDIVQRGSIGRTGGVDLEGLTFTDMSYTYDSDTAKFDYTLNEDLLRNTALTLNSGEGELYGSAYDSAGGYGYYVTRNSPSAVVKVDLATMTRVGA
ncbi:MAG TPA: hypothetical protein VFI22_07950, partial [Thermomicrobiales bacterium]|nr:hypothetical protein [Thermomicrobiales bacterium]